MVRIRGGASSRRRATAASRKPKAKQRGASESREKNVSKSESPLLLGMRRKAEKYARLGMHNTAVFLADKALTISGNIEDAVQLARICYLNGQVHRAIHAIRSRELEKKSLEARLLAAQCLFDIGEFEECLAVLSGDKSESEDNGGPADMYDGSEESLEVATPESDPESRAEINASLCVLRGRASEELEHIEEAVVYYKRALEWDMHCYEAFHRLTSSGMLREADRECVTSFGERLEGHEAGEENTEALAHLTPRTRSQARRPGSRARPGAQAFSGEFSFTRQWLHKFYSASFDTFTLDFSDTTASIDVAGSFPDGDGMRDNTDVLAMQALRRYRALDFRGCLRLTKCIIEREPNCGESVTILHLGALAELRDRLELFKTAHALVENAPRSGVGWMAVGYYYFVCDNFDAARKHFQKAIALDARLLPAWLGLGHAFAAQDESDQSMAAYRSASRMFPGARMPRFYMAVEYTRQSTFAHARVLFQKSLKLTPLDPAPHHELGVIAYKCGEYQDAAEHFTAALMLWHRDKSNREFSTKGGRRSDMEEATLFNLGHCRRKLRQFSEAIYCYERCLALKPQRASTCSALGLALHSSGDFSGAVEMYHRALRFSQEDTLSIALLDLALQDLFAA